MSLISLPSVNSELQQRIDEIMETANNFSDPILSDVQLFLDDPVYLPVSGYCFARESIERHIAAQRCIAEQRSTPEQRSSGSVVYRDSCPLTNQSLEGEVNPIQPVPAEILMLVNDFKEARQRVRYVQVDDSKQIDEICEDYKESLDKLNDTMAEAKSELIFKAKLLNTLIPPSLLIQSYEKKEVSQHVAFVNASKPIKDRVHVEIYRQRAKLVLLSKVELEKKLQPYQKDIKTLDDKAKMRSMAEAARRLGQVVPAFSNQFPSAPLFAELVNEFKALQVRFKREIETLNAPQIMRAIDGKIDRFRAQSAALLERAKALAIGEMSAQLDAVPASPKLTHPPERLSLQMQAVINVFREAKNIKIAEINRLDVLTIVRSKDAHVAQYRARIVELGNRMDVLDGAWQIILLEIERIKDSLMIDSNNLAHRAFWECRGKNNRNIPNHVQAMMDAALRHHETVADFIEALERARRISNTSRFFGDLSRASTTIRLYDAPDLKRHNVLMPG
jgi:hypothetical protein